MSQHPLDPGLRVEDEPNDAESQKANMEPNASFLTTSESSAAEKEAALHSFMDLAEGAGMDVSDVASLASNSEIGVSEPGPGRGSGPGQMEDMVAEIGRGIDETINFYEEDSELKIVTQLPPADHEEGPPSASPEIRIEVVNLWESDSEPEAAPHQPPRLEDPVVQPDQDQDAHSPTNSNARAPEPAAARLDAKELVSTPAARYSVFGAAFRLLQNLVGGFTQAAPSEPEPECDREPESEPEPEPEPETEPEPGSEPGSEPESDEDSEPGPLRDVAAEAFFFQCVEKPEADSYIEYPARVYHIKSRLSGKSAPSSRNTDKEEGGDPLINWQSTFLWQPVLSPSTLPDEHHLHRRPMTDLDRANMAHFLWFRPLASPSTPNPYPPPALGFRPDKDILLLDTDFLETYLYESRPADLADPVNSRSFFASFLPLAVAERAKIKMVAISAEPLRKAEWKSDEALRDLIDDPLADVRGEDRATGEAYRVLWGHRLNEEEKDTIRRRVRRQRWETYDRRVRRRAVARMLVAVFPGLQHVYLVEMACPPGPFPGKRKTGAGPGGTDGNEFAKWSRIQDVIRAEHRQVPKATPAHSRRSDPNAVLYRNALCWNLISPASDDSTSPTSSSHLLTLPQMLEKDISRAKEEVKNVQGWLLQMEEERTHPELQEKRYAKHRATPFSRTWPKRTPPVQKEAEESSGVRAEAMLMMYFEDRFQQARKAGWDPGETMDVDHLCGGPAR